MFEEEISEHLRAQCEQEKQMEENPEDHANKKENELPLSRFIETINLSFDMVLKRCIRKKIQPREYLIESIDREMMEKLYGPKKVEELMLSIQQMRDFDLTDNKECKLAKKEIIDIIQPIIELRYNDENVKQQIQKYTETNKNILIDVGVFQYILQEEEDKKQMILHIPPTTKPPYLKEIRRSLKDLAKIVENNPTIDEISGSTMLLEHPLIQKLGFRIDKESDEGLVPNFHMSREEFISKFA